MGRLIVATLACVGAQWAVHALGAALGAPDYDVGVLVGALGVAVFLAAASK